MSFVSTWWYAQWNSFFWWHFPSTGETVFTCVRFLVRQQDYTKTIQWISTKFGRTPFTFGSDFNVGTDPTGIYFSQLKISSFVHSKKLFLFESNYLAVPPTPWPTRWHSEPFKLSTEFWQQQDVGLSQNNLHSSLWDKNMSSSASLWLNDMFTIVLGQQWSSIVQRNKQNLSIRETACRIYSLLVLVFPLHFLSYIKK